MNDSQTQVQTLSLIRVGYLKVTFLVDNNIEWMAKLPPGFSSELSQHLKHSPPIDELTGVPIIDLENYCCGAHGFSALIETRADSGSDSESNRDVNSTHTVLFDTGPDSKSIIRNINALGVAVDVIERVVLSHWHSDHSGGLLAFLRHRNSINARCGGSGHKRQDTTQSSDGQRHEGDANTKKGYSRVVVDLHPDRPIARGIAPPPNHDKVIGRLPPDPTFDEIEREGAVVELHSEGHLVAGNTVYVSGEIPRETPFEQGLPGGMRWLNGDNAHSGRWAPEPDIIDERYAAIDVLGKGLVIFSACSHAGIANVIRDAISRLQRPIYMIIGGLHLAGPELHERIAPTVHFLLNHIRPSPTFILPMHCSGFAAKIALEEVFGEGCVPAGVGICVEIKGDEEGEAFVGRLGVNIS